MKKYYFIGDIHGCAEELEALLKKINPKPEDEIYSVGDIINKGPDSEKAVQLMLKHNIKAVMGNHDSIIVKVHEYLKSNTNIKPKDSYFELYHSLSESSKQYILNLPYYLEIKEINTLVIHAGLAPNKDLSEQSEEELTCIRIVDPITKEFIRRSFSGYPWHFYYTGQQRVIYGHNAARSIKYKKNTIGIDTGCLYGEKLTAYILPDDKFISVKSKKVYKDYTQGGKFEMPL